MFRFVRKLTKFYLNFVRHLIQIPLKTTHLVKHTAYKHSHHTFNIAFSVFFVKRHFKIVTATLYELIMKHMQSYG